MTQTTAVIDQELLKVCKVWLPLDYDSVLDTPQTIEGVRRNNRRNTAYGCAKVKVK